MPNTY
jgi:bacteriorhodopsin